MKKVIHYCSSCLRSFEPGFKKSGKQFSVRCKCREYKDQWYQNTKKIL